MNLCERVQALAAEGADLTAVRGRLDRILRASAPYDIAAISTVDPAAMLWTSWSSPAPTSTATATWRAAAASSAGCTRRPAGT
ncbi:hypothetical protein FRAHR75_720040 [Frankia sp. Hr75.2]|nr:hypothetical protein FRAHR75_720040 [Frankia sp. Hr75.2]